MEQKDCVINIIRAIFKVEEGMVRILPETLVLRMNVVSQFGCSAPHFPGLLS